MIDRVEPESTGHLLRQGQQMLRAICEDFQNAGFEPVVPLDYRLATDFAGRMVPVNNAEDVVSVVRQGAKETDHVLIIAPETAGRLLQCLDWIKDYQKKLLNPGYDFTRLAGDKNSLQDFLGQRDIAVPGGGRYPDWLNDNNLPAIDQYVLKPGDGCGGEHLQLFELPTDIEWRALPAASSWRVEEFAEGIAASVSVIGSARQAPLMLPPLRQVFEREPVGIFDRCSNDLPDAIARRAMDLASDTVRVLPNPVGFFGIDMVIGVRDVVIEINPRMTMSYCCLRKLVDFNLAAKMVEAFVAS